MHITFTVEITYSSLLPTLLFPMLFLFSKGNDSKKKSSGELVDIEDTAADFLPFFLVSSLLGK